MQRQQTGQNKKNTKHANRKRNNHNNKDKSKDEGKTQQTKTRASNYMTIRLCIINVWGRSYCL